MQRALLLSLLTNSPSIIANPAWSSEARNLLNAAQEFGMGVVHGDAGELRLSGIGRSARMDRTKITVNGSAFNFRTLAAVACLYPGETVIEGNASMLSRPVKDFLSFVTELGGTLSDISDVNHLRIRVGGSKRLGNAATVNTEHSSQVLSAVLLIAPLSDQPMLIRCTTAGLVSAGYVRLTESMMRAQGAHVEQEGLSYLVRPSVYRAHVHHLASDFTAMSYLAGVVAASPSAAITISDYYPSGFNSEREFLTVLDKLGIHTSYDPIQQTLYLKNGGPFRDVIEIDGSNIPTVVPTLAAIAPFIDARVTVRNVAHVNNHKCRRVDSMIHELGRMGCAIEATYDRDSRVDGFTTRGRQTPAGGVTLDSHGDHRIFLSLAAAALGARSSSRIQGAQHLHASFPNFLGELSALGVDLDMDHPLDPEQTVA